MLIATFTRSFYYHDSIYAPRTFNSDKEKEREGGKQAEEDIATQVGGRAGNKEGQDARGVGA